MRLFRQPLLPQELLVARAPSETVNLGRVFEAQQLIVVLPENVVEA